MMNIKPCPFCSNRSTRTIKGLLGKDVHYMIACDNCGCVVSFDGISTQTGVIEAWNKRKYETR